MRINSLGLQELDLLWGTWQQERIGMTKLWIRLNWRMNSESRPVRIFFMQLVRINNSLEVMLLRCNKEILLKYRLREKSNTKKGKRVKPRARKSVSFTE
jgi:hypothetical protein